jgi:hypothetical protein
MLGLAPPPAFREPDRAEAAANLMAIFDKVENDLDRKLRRFGEPSEQPAATPTTREDPSR